MIINSLCNGCLQPFQLIVEPMDVPLVKELADDKGESCPCPRLCGGRINLVGQSSAPAREPMTLTGKQLYQAVKGMGLPDEVPKSVEAVDAILRANKVVGVDVEEHNGKYFLHELKLENGCVVHLASGIKGAQVLKITKGQAHG